MASTTYRQRQPHESTPLQRRAGALGLALAINLAIILALLGVQASKRTPMSFGERFVVDLLPNSPDPAPAPSKARPETRPKLAPPPPPPRARPRFEMGRPIERPLAMIELTREEYAAADVAVIGRSADASAPGSGADDSEEVGRGPSGQILYAAEWAREPTNAEVAGYLPPNAPDGWGMIACRTAPQHRVEDCVELGNHPRGSRLAGAVRQAAWQFRVRPPRKNGRELIGEWVRIRIDYSITR